MLFSSIPFLYYFLPMILIAYYLAPKSIKNMVLLMASLVFYGWGEPTYIILMLISIGIGYIFGILIEKFRDSRWSKVCMITSVVISIGFLVYFKYVNFFITNFNKVTGSSLKILNVVLPIGISFYTFQLVSYIIDVYRNQVKAQRNPIILATYITMFPQLIAGPIVRYSDVERQLEKRSISYDKIAYGIRRFCIGLGKKILIANVLGEYCAAFKATDEKSVLFYWTYGVAVSLQIYFDFSGYSDMAIGLGSLLGFKFMENFNYPFISKSATEFWRRWHMSLGTWFRDYVYIPLGGSRCSKNRLVFNIFVVWMLTGFWHGAEWNFVIWGLYFGILLILEKSFLLKWLEKYKVVGHLYIFIFGIVSFIIFDAVSMEYAVRHIKVMFGFTDMSLVTKITSYYLNSYFIVFIVAIVGATPLPKILIEKLMKNRIGNMIVKIAEPIVMAVLLLVVTGYLVDGSFNPFLYFRF